MFIRFIAERGAGISNFVEKKLHRREPFFPRVGKIESDFPTPGRIRMSRMSTVLNEYRFE